MIVMDNMEFVDVSEDTKKVKKNDKFIKGIYISLLVLVILGCLVYFFGYNILKPYIKV